ncbi:MAG: extracellular solute-binding protein, partial [Desulfurococcales archaeon]|nr:extracellular solute-binding protein [Desulfurococcales archaeon]
MKASTLAGLVVVLAVVIGLSIYLYYSNVASNSAPTKNIVEIVVLSGAGLMKPMNELISSYQNETGIEVQVVYGGSGEILAQLKSGKGDVFIPGAYYYMEAAAKNGLILEGGV